MVLAQPKEIPPPRRSINQDLRNADSLFAGGPDGTDFGAGQARSQHRFLRLYDLRRLNFVSDLV
jgi:hypothetical protein